MSSATASSSERASQLTAPRPLGDRIFSIAAAAAGLLVLVILVLIALSTGNEARPWFEAQGLTGIFANNWDPAHGHYGALAIIHAVPVSLGIALLIAEVVPKRVAQPIVWFIDLLAVVPSVVFGLWGILV